MISPNLEFNYLSDQTNFDRYKDENFNFGLNDLDKEEIKNFTIKIMEKPKNDLKRGNLTIPNFYNNLNKINANIATFNESQDELLKNTTSIKSFRSSWPSYETSKQQTRPDKFRRLSLNLPSNEYPHLKLINFDACKNFKHSKKTVKRQNSAPERLRKLFDDTIVEEDEQQLQNDQSSNDQPVQLDQSNQSDRSNQSDQSSQSDQLNQPTQTKLNQMRYRRRQARYRTQPITFDEIKEVDESQLNDNQDYSINKLLNFHISDTFK